MVHKQRQGVVVGGGVACRNALPGGLAGLISENFAVFRSHGNEELVYAHRRVNRDFSAKECFDFMVLREATLVRAQPS